MEWNAPPAYPLLQSQMRDGRQADAATQNVFDRSALAEQGVDHLRTAGHQRRLAQITQQREHRLEGHPRSTLTLRAAQLDACTQLGQYDQIQYERCGQQRILAGVMYDQSVVATHHYLGGVLVHGTLTITHIGYILDDHHMIGMLARRIENIIRGDHVVDYVTLGNLQ